MRIQHKIAIALGIMIILALCPVVFSVLCATHPPEKTPRPEKWATPLSSHAGLPNLHRVNANLYRSAQPTAEGFKFLNTHPTLSQNDRPIKTILSLRAFHDDDDFLPTTTSLRLEQIHFNTWHPERKDIVKFLRIVTTTETQPVLVHCQHGADRTGTMLAIYRIAVQGWTKEEAIREMTDGGYGFHSVWQNLTQYIKELDIESIKKETAQKGAWK